MEVRYQRDLYRIQLCCDTEKEEEQLGYPLQMCLRNTITGLLACQVQGTDNRLTICWDVTSRHSLVQVTGEGQVSPLILQRILRALLQTMEAMARYLLPCEYLVLDPTLLFLTPESGEVGFVCDFENTQSFHRTLLLLGEYVLEHMDHRDTKAMHLGYGLYRLAVEESFDKDALRQLCIDMPLQEKDIEKNEAENRNSRYGVNGQKTVPPYGMYSKEWNGEPADREKLRDVRRSLLHGQEQEMVMPQKADALEAFFAEDEEEKRRQLTPWQFGSICAVAIFLGTGIMEIVQLIRNGRHLRPIWLLIAAGLFLLSGVTSLLLWWLSEKTEKAETGKQTDKKPQRGERTAPALNQKLSQEKMYGHIPDRQSAERERPETYTAGYYKSTSYPMQNRPVAEPACEPSAQSMETVVLNRMMPETVYAQLCFTDDTVISLRGRQWLIGKSPVDTDICLAKPTVSRMHARIWKKDDAYYIEDLHSRNGTMVEGKLLEPEEKRRLESGMQISFAEYACTFTEKQGNMN